MSTMTLHLQQSSQRYTMPGMLAGDEFDADLSHGADVVGFTEVRSFRDELARAAKRHRYQLLLPESGDTALAVLNGHEILDHRFTPVVPAAAHGPHGPHTARGLQAVELRPNGTAEAVTVAEGHWLTAEADTGHQRIAMTAELADLMRATAQGARLGFWMGDTNNDDSAHDGSRTPVGRQLRKGELTSCWDELGRYPATGPGGGTIDIIGSYDPDTRVECLRARTWHQLHSDHKALSAWYRVSRVRL